MADPGDLTILIDDLYEHEILAIEKVIQALSRHQGHVRVLSDIEREAKERFAEIGIRASVLFYELTMTDGEKVTMPSITLESRMTPIAWDPDRQVHEVTTDLLELGEGGVIKSSADVIPIKPHKH